MKRFFLIGIIATMVLSFGAGELFGQTRLLRKIQEEAEKKAIEEIFGKEKADEPAQPESPGAESRGGRNTRGGGLSQTVPDVNLHIGEASTSFAANNYSSAKASLRQALWGVELEMGQQVLKSLPEKVSDMPFVANDDRVSSSGVGFVGLVIERRFEGKEDMELNVSIGNDSGLLGIAGLALSSGMYMNTSDQTNQKQIRFQEHTAYISYDDYDGYTLGVPFGQSSVFVLQGVNFASESAFMAAADQFSIQTVKQKLGVQ